MLIQIIDSQLRIFPKFKSFLYRGNDKDKFKPEFITINIMECSKDLDNFDYIGKITKLNEITIIVQPNHYQDLINLHLNRHKPDLIYLKMKNRYVSYYGFSC